MDTKKGCGCFMCEKKTYPSYPVDDPNCTTCAGVGMGALRGLGLGQPIQYDPSAKEPTNPYLTARQKLAIMAGGLESRASYLRALLRALPQEMSPEAEAGLGSLVDPK